MSRPTETLGSDTPSPPGPPDWQAVLDAVSGYLIIADRSRRIRLLSRPPFGSGLDEYIGHDLADFVAADQRDQLIAAVEEVLGGAAVVEGVARSAKTGRWFRGRTVGIRDQGRVTGLVSHLIDVDEETRNRSELARLRAMAQGATPDATGRAAGSAESFMQRLGLMIDSLPFLVSYVDQDHRYQYNNAAYEYWFGVSRDELFGRHMSEMLGDAAYARLRPSLDEALRGAAVDLETDLPYRGGTTRRVRAHLRPDLGADGEARGFFAFVQDITERRRAEAAVRQREHEMRQMQKMEALGRLSGGIAHEFSNLLQTVIAGCSGLLVLLRDREPEAAQQIARIRGAAQRGTALTRQLLSFSRPAEPGRATLDIDPLIDDMGFLLERLLGVAYRLEVDTHANCRVFADAGEIQQVLMNLAINARDAMPDGGLLSIETQRLEVDTEEAERHAGLRAGAYALIIVSDTGTGMDQETLDRMFDPFFTTKTPDRGTGLGLATVYGIIQRLGGHVDVESAPGQGTTFRLYLPCHE